MSFVMHYDERNRRELDKLADQTKAMAYDWYQFCIDNEIEILITETLRDEATQKANVAKGASQTMRSYHLVGQALDYVPAVGSKIDYSLYEKQPYKKALDYAKKIGFSWGGDWTSLVDKPHLENKKIGYGKDTFSGKKVTVSTGSQSTSSSKTYSEPPASRTYLQLYDKGSRVTEVQKLLVAKGYKVATDGYYGNDTKEAVEKFQKANGLKVDGLAGKDTIAKLKAQPKKETSKPVTYETIKHSSRNASVTKAQQLLKDRGYKITVDGIFGSATETAVKEFQRAVGLKVDGIVGKDTWNKLLESPKLYGVATGDVWLHSKADFKDATRTKVLKKGERVDILSDTGDMFKTDKGYVSKKYILKKQA